MKIPCGILLLFLSYNTFAQQFTVSVSEQMRYEGASPLKFGDNYFSINADTKMQFGFTFKLNKVKYSITLSKYDATLKLIKEVKLSNGERVYGPFKPLLRKINDRLYLLYYQLVEEDDRITLSACEVDLSDLSLKAPNELVSIEQKNVGIQQAMDLITSNNFQFTSAPDGSKLLALWSSGINNRFFFSVLDKNLKKVRSGEEAINGESEIVVSNACINDNGDVFVSYNADKHAHVLCNRASLKTVSRDVTLPAGNPYEAFVLPPANGSNDVRIVGTYKEGKDGLTGIFAQTATTPAFQLSAPVKTPFSATLVEQFDKDGWASTKPKKYGLLNLNFVSFLLADGSIDLIGEFRRIETGTRTSFLISGGILNVHFKKDAVVCSRIPKARVSAGSAIADSYKVVPFENGIVIFYNDHESNIKKDITSTPERSDNYKNDVLVAATIANDGTVKREILADLSRQDFLPVAEDLQRLSSSSLLVPARRIKGFGKVTEDFKWVSVFIK